MKDTMHGGEPTVETRDNTRKTRKRFTARCSICNHRTWFNAVPINEPAGVPEPRRRWTLCTECHAALLEELRRSPVRSSLRLRIAMGLVAAERGAQSLGTEDSSEISDSRWIVILAWGFGIAMILHLVLIVMLAFVAGH